MRLTKLTHACLLLTKDDASLLIDPGSFGELPQEMPGLAGVICTHEHADHASPDHLQTLRAGHGELPILGADGVVRALPEHGLEEASPGQHRRLGPFDVRFGGGSHALIHSSIPAVSNVTVLVDGAVYHPGDSLEPPAQPVQVLAVPVSGPWLKLGEAMDYVLASKAQQVLPIHDALNTSAAQGIANARIAWAAEQIGARFTALEPGEHLDL